MGFLKDLFLGKEQYPLKKKEKKTIKQKEREAYLKGLTQARIVRAKKLGRQKGAQKPKSRLAGIGASLESASLAAKGYMDIFDMDLGYGAPTKRRKSTKKKKPSRGTTIKVNGTTITIATKRKKKK